MRKTRRTFTVDDCARAMGREPVELKAALHQQRLETEATSQDGPADDKADEAAADAEVEFDDEFADTPTRASQPIAGAVAERIRIIEAKLRVTEYTLSEVVNDYYRNTIRFVAKPRIKGKPFADACLKLSGTIARNSNIIQIKKGPMHVDLIYRLFDKPKAEVDAINKAIKDLTLDYAMRTVPPFTPLSNIMRLAPRAAFSAYAAAVELNRDNDNVDDRLPKEMMPTTKWPVPEARTPKWSMSTPDGHCFLSAEHDRKTETIRVAIEKTVKVKKVTFSSNDFSSEIARHYVGPQKLVVVHIARTPEGLVPAPDFKEARKDKFMNAA